MTNRLDPTDLRRIVLLGPQHRSREERQVSVADALAWLEGLPEGEPPGTVHPDLLHLAEDWNRLMDEGIRKDVMNQLLPHLLETAGINIKEDLQPNRQILDRVGTVCTALPEWLRLGGFRFQARELDFADSTTHKTEDYLIHIASEIVTAGPEQGRWNEAHHAVLASGQKFAYWEPWEAFTSAENIATECAYRTMGDHQRTRMMDVTRRNAQLFAQNLRRAIREAPVRRDSRMRMEERGGER